MMTTIHSLGMTSWSAINARQEEAAIAIGVYKLAVRISIGSGCFGAMFGWITMLGNMVGGSGSMDLRAFEGGAAVALVTTLYGLILAFTFFLLPSKIRL